MHASAVAKGSPRQDVRRRWYAGTLRYLVGKLISWIKRIEQGEPADQGSAAVDVHLDINLFHQAMQRMMGSTPLRGVSERSIDQACHIGPASLKIVPRSRLRSILLLVHLNTALPAIADQVLELLHADPPAAYLDPDVLSAESKRAAEAFLVEGTYP